MVQKVTMTQWLAHHTSDLNVCHVFDDNICDNKHSFQYDSGNLNKKLKFISTHDSGNLNKKLKFISTHVHILISEISIILCFKELICAMDSALDFGY